MKTVSNDSTVIRASDLSQAADPYLRTFSVTLSNGRKVTIREMTGEDLLYVEEELLEMGDYKRAFHLTERLSVGDTITFAEVSKLKNADIEKLAGLVAKASGQEDTNPK